MPRFWVIAALALSAAMSCESSLSLDELLVGKACRIAADGGTECLTGYHCVQGRCVRYEEGVGGSSSGQGGSGGDTSSGAGGEDENGGTSSSGGSSTGGSSQGGAGGNAGAGGSSAQGGSDVPDAAVTDGCVPGPLYRDRDGDGYGSDAPADIEFGCQLSGYVNAGGDCYDESRGAGDSPELAYPGQTQFLYQLLIDPTKPNNQSYDFDCDGVEEPDPSYPGPPSCPGIALGCSGSGYAETGRTGTGINGLCGSEVIAACEVQLTACVETTRSATNEGPLPCR